MRPKPTLRQLKARFNQANEGTKEHIRQAIHGALRDVQEFGTNFYASWNNSFAAEQLLEDFQAVFGKPKPRV